MRKVSESGYRRTELEREVGDGGRHFGVVKGLPR